MTILRERPKPSSEQSVTSLTRELLRVTLSGLTGILGSKRGKTMLKSQYKRQQKHRKHALHGTTVLRVSPREKNPHPYTSLSAKAFIIP